MISGPCGLALVSLDVASVLAEGRGPRLARLRDRCRCRPVVARIGILPVEQGGSVCRGTATRVPAAVNIAICQNRCLESLRRNTPH